MRDQAKAVARVGRSYAVNTIGAIAGAFITGFVSDSENQHEVYVVAGCDVAVCSWRASLINRLKQRAIRR